MKDYTLFSVRDFVMDEYFQSWVLNPVEDTDSFWQSWMREYSHKRIELEEARSILLRLQFTHHDLPSSEISKLWNHIRKEDNPVKSERPFQRKTFLWYGAAAAMLIAGLTTFFWPTVDIPIEHRTTYGQTKTIVLPDSSTVILNSNSSLRLAANWKKNSVREVWLEGEAFFSVVHKVNNQPFKVKTTEDVAIEVLGTTFNVYHRNETKIVLNSGLIQLSLPTAKADEKIYMGPGELVEYDKKKYIRRMVDPQIYTAWTENNLVLNRTSLRELIRMISDNYGIEVEVREGLLDQTISGSMPVTTAESLIQQIAKAFQLKVVKEEDEIFMREE